MNVPLYRHVYGEIKRRISSGDYARGTTLPSEPKLGEEFGVSIITVRRALHELALDGLVEQRQGVGTFVRSSGQRVEISMSSFTSDVADGRLRVVRTLLIDDMVPALDELALRLGVQPGSMLRHLVRLDTEGGVPLELDEVFSPPALAASITPEVASSPLFLHLWQKQASVRFASARYDISVQMPDSDKQRVLQIGPDVPVLVTGELVFDSSHRPWAWIVSRYRGDRCRLSGTVGLVQRETEHGTIGE